MRCSILAAVVGLLCVNLAACGTVESVGNRIEGVVSRVGGGPTSSAPAEAKPATAERVQSTKQRSIPIDRGCVQSVSRVSLGTEGSWASGEVCIAPNADGNHQVKLTLTGTDTYTCKATICAVDVAFGDGRFRTMRVFDGGARGVVFIANRDTIEKALPKAEMMSIRVTFDGGRWATLKFDTRGFKK